MSYRVLALVENDQLLLVTRAVVRHNDGSEVGIPVVGGTIRLVVKASPDAADASGTTVGASPDLDTPGMLAVQVPGEVTATAGAYWHRIYVETLDHPGRRTIQYGPLRVVDA